MDTYPKIKSVKPLENHRLLVCFVNNITKTYDCSELLKQSTFFLLRNKALFKAVQVDVGGYGISWNDELDLSEAELWRKGKFYLPMPDMYRHGVSSREGVTEISPQRAGNKSVLHGE